MEHRRLPLDLLVRRRSLSAEDPWPAQDTERKGMQAARIHRSEREVPTAAPARRANWVRQRWPASAGAHPLVWVAGILGIILLLVAYNLWQCGCV
jgi:hypothetical protein